MRSTPVWLYLNVYGAPYVAYVSIQMKVYECWPTHYFVESEKKYIKQMCLKVSTMLQSDVLWGSITAG